MPGPVNSKTLSRPPATVERRSSSRITSFACTQGRARLPSSQTSTIAGHAISYDLAGSLPRALAAASSVAQAFAVLAATWLYLRGRDDPQRLVVACAAALTGFLAFTRFFSPQYLVWLLPFVALLGPVAWALTAAALVLAHVWFFHYRDVFALGGYVWLVALRDLLVVALFVLVALRLRGRAVKDEDAVLLEDETPVRVPS